MLQLKAFAKINLSLKILGKRPDGYHEIESQMQSISLHDLIRLQDIPRGIELSVSDNKLPADGRNLAYRAAAAFIDSLAQKKMAQTGVSIDLQKNIPLAAGLAGGSADAAAVLYGMNLLSGKPFSEQELSKLGEAIGSDVPFCLLGGNCLVKGRGETIVPSSPSPVPFYVLVVPEVEVSTAWAYRAWDEKNSKVKSKNSKRMNDLEEIVMEKCPIIREARDRLLALGCSYAQMSGSGASVFGEVDSRARGEEIISSMKEQYKNSYLVAAVGQGIEEVT